jgi:uncharacterized membrane protein
MDILTLAGLTLNTIGSVFLAFSLNRTTKMLNTSVTALEHFKDTYLSGGDVLSFTGIDIHRNRALKNSRILTNIGLTLLILGFVLQIISLTTNQTSP